MVPTTASVASCPRHGAYHCIRSQFVETQGETVHTTASVASCRDTPSTLHPELSCPWGSMEAATFPHVSWDSTSANQIPSSQVPNTFHTTRVQRQTKLCWLDAGRDRHVTRRDVVSSQTEGNSVSVVEAVHKFISGVKHHKQRIMLASPLGCGRSDQSLITFACKT